MTFRLARSPILALAAIALSGCIVVAQQTTAPESPTPPNAPPAAPIERQSPSDPMQPGMRSGMMRGEHSGPGSFRDREGSRGPQGGMRGADFEIAPPGMWWKNARVIQRLALTPEQTQKMDGIFQQSRLHLIDLKATVEKQQVLLEPMLSANPIESAKAMVQIDKVAQARADLEKAHSRMLLGIRGVLTPDQWTKLNTRGFGGPGPADFKGGANHGGPTGGGRGQVRGPAGPGPTPSTNNLIEPIDQP